MAYFVYLLRCKNGSIYTGITTDTQRRLAEHKNKRGGRYTRSHEVQEIIYTEEYPNRSEALKREAEIKSWRRKKKINLVKPNID
jgi:putative endonuclease